MITCYNLTPEDVQKAIAQYLGIGAERITIEHDTHAFVNFFGNMEKEYKGAKVIVK